MDETITSRPFTDTVLQEPYSRVVRGHEQADVKVTHPLGRVSKQAFSTSATMHTPSDASMER